jgi:hypothetical protein
VDPGQRGQVVVGGPLGGAQGAVAVHAPEKLVVVAGGVLVQADHERAAVRLDHDPALAVEGDHGLPDGDPADAELAGDLVLRDPVPDAELALEDLAPDVVGDLLGAGGAVQPARRRGDIPERLGNGGKTASDRSLLDNWCLPTTVWLP